MLRVLKMTMMACLAAGMLAGCQHPLDAGSGPSGAGYGGTTKSPLAASPPVEATGTERPQSPGYGGGGGGGRASLAKLPIGVNGGDGPNGECVQVTWGGKQPIPDRDMVTVARVTVARDGDSGPYIKESPGAECGRSCDGYTFKPSNQDVGCYVRVRVPGATLDLGGTDSAYGTITLYGKVSCLGGGSCKDDRAAIDSEQSTIPATFTVSYDPAGTSSPTSDTPWPADSSSP
jgi:hypothetical protein